MRTIFTVLVLMLCSTHLAAENDNAAQLEDKAKQLAAQLGMQFKARLQSAIGTVRALLGENAR